MLQSIMLSFLLVLSFLLDLLSHELYIRKERWTKRTPKAG